MIRCGVPVGMSGLARLVDECALKTKPPQRDKVRGLGVTIPSWARLG